MATAPIESASGQVSNRVSLQFGLKHLIFIITAVGVVLTPAYWLGGFYLTSFFFSAGLIAACSLVYATKYPSWSLPVALAGVGVSFVLAMGLIVFFFHAVLNAGLVFLMLLMRVKPRPFVVALVLLAVGLYGLILWNGAARIHELIVIKSQNPFVSLTGRLAFEQEQAVSNSNVSTVATLSPAVEEYLKTCESYQLGSHDRGRSLYLLHEQTYAQFAQAAGFGMMRMPSLRRESFALDPQSKETLPVPINLVSRTPVGAELLRAHRSTLLDFTDQDRMGYVRNRNAVAGFQAHLIGAPVDRSNYGDPGRPAFWQVDKLELVSLLRHDEPQVYVTQTPTQMDQLADAQHRALNEFEAAALPKLVSQEDIVVDQTPEHIRMLGAVRAANDCLQCHEGGRGKLLGAFSYEMSPIATRSAEN